MRHLLKTGLFFACVIHFNVWASDTGFEAAHSAYEGAVAGTISPDKALEAVDLFLKEHPEDPVGLAMRGSVKTMLARTAWLPWQKLGYVNEGIELMDKAVANAALAKSWDGRDPKIVIWMISGTTNAKLPKMFNRRAFAQRDFQNVLEAPVFQRMAAGDRASVYAWLAVIANDQSNPKADQLLHLAQSTDAAIADKIWDKRWEKN